MSSLCGEVGADAGALPDAGGGADAARSDAGGPDAARPDAAPDADGATPTCGDGHCDPGETCSSCPADCGCTQGHVCSGGACVACAQSCTSVADCTANPAANSCCGQCCVDRLNDPLNCGDCGHACGGATPACVGGICQ
jgi:hypothetical protein